MDTPAATTNGVRWSPSPPSPVFSWRYKRFSNSYNGDRECGQGTSNWTSYSSYRVTSLTYTNVDDEYCFRAYRNNHGSGYQLQYVWDIWPEPQVTVTFDQSGRRVSATATDWEGNTMSWCQLALQEGLQW